MAEFRTLSGHTSSVNAVAVTPDGKLAVSASQHGTLKVWELESGRELRTLTGRSDRVRAVAVTPERQRAVSASDDETLKIWELNTGEVFASLSCDGHALCCAFHVDKRIISGDAVGRVPLPTLEEPRRKN